MHKFTTIIFDLGGVLLNNDWHDGNQEKFKVFEETFGVTYDAMERGWDAAWPDYQLGKISETEFWNTFLKVAGSQKGDISQAKQLWKRYVSENESMLSLLKELKSQGYLLAALTTISKEWLDYKIEKYDLNHYFDTIVSSGYTGLAKPDPKIYQMVLDNLNVTATESIFVDDSENTLPPAKEMGIKTLLFTSQSELEKKLTELLAT